MKRVLMTDELFDALGASKVDWGQPDAEGFYTPTVYADTTEATLRAFLDGLYTSGHPMRGYSKERRLGWDEAIATVRAALQQPAVQPERPFRSAEDIRAAINDACPLSNPRLSEVDWAAVGRAFDARRAAVQSEGGPE